MSEARQALDNIRYYGLMNECITSAINRLNPLNETFESDFNELFKKYMAAVDNLVDAKEKAKTYLNKECKC